MKKIIFNAFLLLICSNSIIAQSRIVLIEQFSNAGCSNCASFSPSIYSYVNTNPSKAVCISYHTSFPYDDYLYIENQTASDDRVAYYGVASVPYTILDGNYNRSSTSPLLANLSTSVDTRNLVTPKYQLEATNLSISHNNLSGSIVFTSAEAGNASENLVAQIVVIEKNVLKSSYSTPPGANAETEYGYVMRKMIPNASGTNLINKNLSGKDTLPFNLHLDNLRNVEEVRVVAFVQNNSTKEVYQAELFSPSLLTLGIQDQNSAKIDQLKIYPNPINKTMTIVPFMPEYIHSVQIINQLGEMVYEKNIEELTSKLDLEIDLNCGIYFLRVMSKNSNSFQKILIQK